eukprot:scaffold40806_cov53-Attheya_sp.AAC.6
MGVDIVVKDLGSSLECSALAKLSTVVVSCSTRQLIWRRAVLSSMRRSSGSMSAINQTNNQQSAKGSTSSFLLQQNNVPNRLDGREPGQPP